MQEQVLELRNQSRSIRAIGSALGISRNTVRAILRKGGVGAEPAGTRVETWRDAVEWPRIERDHGRGATLKVLHAELALAEVTYKRFWNEYRRRYGAVRGEISMRLEHRPGERTFFDFADGLFITDRKTGVKTPTQLFVGVLPFSSRVEGCFVDNQKQPTLMRAIEDFFFRLSVLTPYIVVDNLKSAVHRAHLYDPDVNPAFVEFANHWGFAVLPARPYRARDKATVEATIGVIQRQFYVEVRERIFYSLAEINAAFRLYLERLNGEPMKDHGGATRMERFETERASLKPLPTTERFEISDWKTAKVHPDCHIQVERRFYSVPSYQAGNTVRVCRISRDVTPLISPKLTPLISRV